MEENKVIDIAPEKGCFDYEKCRSISYLSICFYIIVMYILNLFIQMILMAISPMITGIEYYTDQLGEIVLSPENELFINSWTQIIVYLIMTIGLVWINKKSLVNDLIDFKHHTKHNLLSVLIGFGIFWGATIFSNLLMMLLQITDASENQEQIEAIVSGRYGLMVTIAVVILGPLCEEIIFRRSIFNIFKPNTNSWFKIIVSGVIFGFIHVGMAILSYIMVGESINVILTEFILGIPYIIQGIALSYIYYQSKCNLLPVLTIHILNNLIAALLILV